MTRLMCIKCGQDYLEHQTILAEIHRERCLCLNCWDKFKRINVGEKE
jgi:hypothetical protein